MLSLSGFESSIVWNFLVTIDGAAHFIAGFESSIVWNLPTIKNKSLNK